MDKITPGDITNFYYLFYHYDTRSNNYVIIGNKKRFDNFINKLRHQYKNKENVKFLRLMDGKKYIFLYNDIEYIYIHAEYYSDLTGYKFKKIL